MTLPRSARTKNLAASLLSPTRLSQALALALLGVSLQPNMAEAQVKSAWFAISGGQNAAQVRQRALPLQGMAGPDTAAQQMQSRQKLQHSLDNVNRVANAIAAQQAAQNAARLAAQQQAGGVAEGLAAGGLEVATGDQAHWQGAKAPVHTQENGRHTVAIEQTESKAILNWNRFDVGRNTTVQFQQKSSDAVLNRVVGAQAAPSQIQGAIKGDGTVMVVNQNGVVFSGSSQVNVRNLVAAAANITNEQFLKGGLYVNTDGSLPTFTDALGKVDVQAGAQIQTHTPSRSTDGGGYVLLMGQEVHNAGQIHTPKGQTALAAGDTFYIRKGQGTDGNAQSTTRGNEVVAHRKADSQAGLVTNRGLISAATGDITLTGHDVRQAGVLVSTTSTSQRGAIHLSTRRSDADGRVTLESGSTTAILVDAESADALDSQRDSQMVQAGTPNAFSRIDIASGKTIEFQSDSLTLATGGEIATHAEHRTLLRNGAELDVAGQVGVRVAMDSNQLLINAQGNEQRDAPINRDSKNLNNKDIWVDRRLLVFVPKGTQGYESDRWYTAGGLLEVSGYLNTAPHSIGEWLAQGGTITATGQDFVSEAGSRVNLSGGTLDVQSGKINLTWLRGEDGRLYEASRAPGDLLYQGVYQGWQALHPRWGEQATRTFHNPLIGPRTRFEPGYTVGRDAGHLVIGTTQAALHGDIINDVYQGPRQIQAAQAGMDGYLQSQTAVARRAALTVANLVRHFDTAANRFDDKLLGLFRKIHIQEVETAESIGLDDTISKERQPRLNLSGDWLNSAQFGRVRLWALESVNLDSPLLLPPGGELHVQAPQIDVHADIWAPSGAIRLDAPKANPPLPIQEDKKVAEHIIVHPGVTLSTRGLRMDLNQDPAYEQAYLHGGDIALTSLGDLLLEAGSTLDVSTGTLRKLDRQYTGGRGGSITLNNHTGNIDNPAELKLDAKLLGYGVTDAGTLDIQTDRPISIGGPLQHTTGALNAGEEAHASLILEADYQIQKGEPLPFDYQILTWTVSPGERVVAPGYLDDTIQYTVPVDWHLDPDKDGRISFYDSKGTYYAAQSYQIVPKGTIFSFGRASWAVFNPLKVRKEIFPDGVTLKPSAGKKITLQKGSIAEKDYSVKAGSLIPVGSRLERAIRYTNRELIPQTQIFEAGFKKYNINSTAGLFVPENQTLDIQRKILNPETGAAYLPVLYALDPKGTIKQRSGASLSFQSGAIHIASGARIKVDPLQIIALKSSQTRLEGSLIAPGGQALLEPGPLLGSNETPTGTLHLGPQAHIDVSAAAWTGMDKHGRSIGTLSPGGSIMLGGQLFEDTNTAPSTNASLILMPGSRLDASGGQITVNPDGGELRTLASDGGSIMLGASRTLLLHGDVSARAGGAGAQGGRLAILLDTPMYARGSTDLDIRQPRELWLSQHHPQWQEPTNALTPGQNRVGVDWIQSGGFADLTLFSGGLIGFDGSVDLSMPRELRLYAGGLGVADETAQARVRLAAPYVRLAEYGDINTPEGFARTQLRSSNEPTSGTASLQVQASHLDIQGIVNLSATAHWDVPYEPSQARPYQGFQNAVLSSQGDIRFIQGQSYVTELNAPESLTLEAQRIYPDSHTTARVNVGLQQSTLAPEGALLIRRPHAGASAIPHSVFGSLYLNAAHIQHDGSLYAPMGLIQFGNSSIEAIQTLRLSAGSLTSISAQGLTLPYGGTLDGLDYVYKGPSSSSVLQPAIGLRAEYVQVDDGALLDLNGGGELLGAGFIAGRGGSVDTRLYPLMQVNRNGKGFTLPSIASNPVYAIVPGYTADYAPFGQGEGAVAPAHGQHITLEHGLPGLPAGTYTLLPSSYAVLPGAFRVEFNGAAQVPNKLAPTTLRNGSWSTQAWVGRAGQPAQRHLAQGLIISSADMVRRYSQYNSTSYSDFIRQEAIRNATVRRVLPEDGKQLLIDLVNDIHFSLPTDNTPLRLLDFRGQARFEGTADGYGGAATLSSTNGHLHILPDHDIPVATKDRAYAKASDLNRLGATRLTLGSWDGNDTKTIAVHSESALRAPEIILIAEHIQIQAGAILSTLGAGPADSSAARQGRLDTPAHNMLVLSNSQYEILPIPSNRTVTGRIDIGACDSNTVSCATPARLYSEGMLALVTNGPLRLGEQARYGARHLSLATSNINVGSEHALDAARAQGMLPAGLTLNQGILDRLLQGDTSWGAPALEQLSLTAGQSLNFWGNVALDTTDPATGRSRMERLVLRTPAIYGAGQAGEQAYLRTGDLYWTGLMQAAPAPMLGGAGHGQGTLRIDAEQFILGYDPFSRPNNTDRPERLTLGFDTVDVTARRAFTASHEGSLKVYRRWTGEDQNGSLYDGGHLLIRTPLLTGRSGSASHITAGGALRVQGLPGATADASLAGMGSEIRLAAQQINVDTRVVLPSGQFQAHAQQDLILGPQASLNLAGKTTTFFDDEEATQYSWGGDIILASQHGNVILDAQSLIDVSAINNHAGYLTVQAPEGRVALQGRVLGGASGQYDAGGTWVPYRHAQLELQAKHLGLTGALSEQFALLNQRLDQGEVWGARQFQFGEGDLHIGGAVRAGQIGIALDQGHLTVDGLLDASGAQVGQIRLNAKHGLTLTGRAMLDAHGRLLRVDSYGQIIHSPNRAVVELNSGQGRLTLNSGARIDLRHGTDTPERDPEARGSLWLYAPRLDAADSGRMAVQADAGLDIAGARQIVLHAVQQYFDAPAGTDAAASGRPYQVITQGWLDAKHTESTRFINNALANTGLIQNQLAGLTAYRDAFHLRPAVEILSATPDGDLVVQGDLDLSKYRYNSLNPNSPLTAVYGSGEAGALAIRAGGDLAIYGSINDGFAPPPATPDDDGWVLVPGKQPFGGDVIVPIAGVKLEAGTQYPAGRALNFDLPAGNVTLPAGTRLPVDVTLDAAYTLPAGSVFRADVHAPDGSLLLRAGAPVPEGGLALQQGAKLGAGLHLPASLTVQNITWPKGVTLPVAMNQADQISLPVGALLPADTDIKLADGLFRVPLRPLDGDRQAYNWALAPMLPSGSQSWNIRLVAGADTAAADPRSLRSDAAHGSLVLGDTHYGMEKEYKAASIWVWAPGNWADMPAGEAVPEEYLEYCESDPTLCVRQAPPPQYVWAEGNWADMPAGQPVPAEYLEYCEGDPSLCTLIDTAKTELAAVHARQPNLSVLRTGTGDLELSARQNVTMRSPYGIYTAGTNTLLGGDQDAAFQQTLAQTEIKHLLNSTDSHYESRVEQAHQYDSLRNPSQPNWYPDHGGNLLLRAGGNLSGDSWGVPASLYNAQTNTNSSDVANWLWTQGTGNVDTPAAWSINFGSYVLDSRAAEWNTFQPWPRQIGFSGIGTLGGGNLDVQVDGQAGLIQRRNHISAQQDIRPRSDGLVLAIASNGRVLNGQQARIGGGGDLSLRLAGGWNSRPDALQIQLTGQPTLAQAHNLAGGIINLRGQVQLRGNQVGILEQRYGLRQVDLRDTRALDPYVSSKAHSVAGLILTLGDASANLAARRSLVMAAVNDAGRLQSPVYRDDARGMGQSWFTLWTDSTSVKAWAAGGQLGGDTRFAESTNTDLNAPYFNNFQATDGFYMLPGQYTLVATQGSIYQGYSNVSASNSSLYAPLMLAPQGKRQLTLLAGQSYYGSGLPVAQSAASPSALATPFQPGFRAYAADRLIPTYTNISDAAYQNGTPLHAFGAMAAADSIALRAAPYTASRVLARDGDIVGLWLGGLIEYNRFSSVNAGQRWHTSAGAASIQAGRDIIWSGQRNDEDPMLLSYYLGNPRYSGNLILHTHPNDVSTITAGRDIRYLNLMAAGPGTVEITAGRNIIQEDKAGIVSLGPVVAGDTRPGAGIVLQAGMNNSMYAGLLQQYLNPALRADASQSLAGQPRRVVHSYEGELMDWLRERYGVTFSGDDAVPSTLAYFQALPAAQQRIFARDIYFAELREGGREYNDEGGPRSGSYLRGRRVIQALFPELDMNQQPIVYDGDVLLFGGAGVHTNQGGDIQMLAPGGGLTFGVEGPQPPSTAGIITRGRGNIQLYSRDSILLGQSRVMTSFGGDILAWANRGDINAGRGSKTTVVYTPPLRVYDSVGNVRISPDVPSTGAGIATLAPIPEVPAGDVDLIAPEGVIDAGEAGIRVSGNVNVAALQVINSENIKTQGESKGIPVVAAVNTGALTSASAAASSATAAAQDVVQRNQAARQQNQPSIVTVQILGFGDS